MTSITDSTCPVNGQPQRATTEKTATGHQAFVERTLARWRAEDAEQRAAEARGERVRRPRTEIVEEV